MVKKTQFFKEYDKFFISLVLSYFESIKINESTCKYVYDSVRTCKNV